MTVRGRVRGRSIELAEALPELEGREVVLDFSSVNAVDVQHANVTIKEMPIWDEFLEAGATTPPEVLTDLPSDLSERHDRYAWGGRAGQK